MCHCVGPRSLRGADAGRNNNGTGWCGLFAGRNNNVRVGVCRIIMLRVGACRINNVVGWCGLQE